MSNPGAFLLSQLLGLIALGVFAFALYLLFKAGRSKTVPVSFVDRFSTRPDPALANQIGTTTTERTRLQLVEDPKLKIQRGWLATVALALLALVFAGRFLVAIFVPSGSEHLPALPSPRLSEVAGASGAKLAVAEYGPKEAPIVLFTHGWGNDRREWLYAVSALPAGFNPVVWDLPGLGASTAATDYSVATLAADLASVVTYFKGRPIVLVGHSIGGMLNLELVRLHPEKQGREVVGIVEANTSYTNPILTKKDAERSAKLQKPVFEPLLHLITWISPVAQLGGWLAYQSGLAHIELAMDSFAGSETWGELDEMARYSYRSSPGVIAHGMLGMMHWDASDVFSKIVVPTLVITGAQDTTTLPAAGEHIASEVRSSQLVSVTPAAHLGPVEQYKRYAAEIAAFASKTLKVAPPSN